MSHKFEGSYIRWALSRFIPQGFIEFPFEVFLTAASLIIGIPVLIGISEPGSLVAEIPIFAVFAWGISLLLGALTVAFGLIKPHLPDVLSSGLQLLGGAMCVYGTAQLIALPFVVVGASSALFLIAGLLALVRSLYFRRIIDIKKRARRLNGGP